MLIILSLVKESPHIQYIEGLLQRNLIEDQETWCLLMAKKLNGYVPLEVVQIFIPPFVYKMGSVIVIFKFLLLKSSRNEIKLHLLS